MFYINVETGEVRVNAEAEPLVRRSSWGFSTPPLAHSVQRAAYSLQPAAYSLRKTAACHWSERVSCSVPPRCLQGGGHPHPHPHPRPHPHPYPCVQEEASQLRSSLKELRGSGDWMGAALDEVMIAPILTLTLTLTRTRTRTLTLTLALTLALALT